MSITSAAFKGWAAAFKKRRAYQGHKTECEEEDSNGILVSSTIAKLKSKAGVSNPDLLTDNLLYACYQAEAALTFGSDPADRRREQFRGGYKTLSKVRTELNVVADMFEKYPDLIAAALKYPDAPVGLHDCSAKRYKPSIQIEKLVEAVAPALRKIIQAHKVSLMNDDPTFSDLTADCTQGPFNYHHRRENRGRSSGPKKDFPQIVEDGLIFHLSYIARYFTGGSADKNCQAKVSKHGEVVISGSMIRLGKPNEAAVAHLFNAAMGKKLPTDALSGRDVKERLRVLLKPSKPSDKDELSNAADLRTVPFSDFEFIGWPSVEG